jgi:hypothetical protein
MARRHNTVSPISLYEAAWRYSTRAMKTAAIKERSQPASRLPVAKFDISQRQELPQKIVSIGNRFLDLIDNLRDRHEPTLEMMTSLVQHLGEGILEAYGMMTKPDLGHEPQRIPPYLFKGRPKINWSANTIDNLNRRFEIVEVMRPMPTPAPLELANKSKTRRGRPRVDDEITEVARELDRDRQFDGLSEKEIVALVQSHCQRRYPKRFRTRTRPSPTKIREILRRLDI